MKYTVFLKVYLLYIIYLIRAENSDQYIYDTPKLDISCNFNNNNCDWYTKNYVDDDGINIQFWSRTSMGTPSRNTGPNNGHECNINNKFYGKFCIDSQTDSNYYLYTEATSNFNRKFDLILRNSIIANKTNCGLNFWTSMYGKNMGSLYLQIKYNNTKNWNTIWSRTGNSGTRDWNQNTVFFQNSSIYFNLRFRASTGNGYRSDIAIDDIYFGCDIILEKPDIEPLKIHHFNAIPITMSTSLGIIKYTTDGSNPISSSTAKIYSLPFTIFKTESNNKSQILLIKAVSTIDNKYSAISSVIYNITSGFGNGQIDFNEECDDGNILNGDGCSSNCKLEKGFNCCPNNIGIDICKRIENSLPYNFSGDLSNLIVDSKFGNDNDGWSYCGGINNNCYLGTGSFQIRFGYNGNYIIKDYINVNNKFITCNTINFPIKISYTPIYCYKRNYNIYKNKGTYLDPYKTIKKAFYSSNNNSTIFLLRGEYKSFSNINLGLTNNHTLYGLCTPLFNNKILLSSQVSINGENTYPLFFSHIYDNIYLSLKNLLITNFGSHNANGAIILSQKKINVNIKDCIFNNLTSDYGLFNINNKITSIPIEYGSTILFENTIINNSVNNRHIIEGFFKQSFKNCKFYYNNGLHDKSFISNKYGILDIADSSFFYNNFSASILENNPVNQHYTKINIRNNYFYSNIGVPIGILLRDSNGDIEIYNNKIIKSKIPEKYQHSDFVNSLKSNLNLYLNYASQDEISSFYRIDFNIDIGVVSIFLYNSDYNYFNIKNNTIEDNIGNGIRFQLINSNHNIINIIYNIFAKNIAIFNGGGVSIFNNNCKNNSLILNFNDFYNNTAQLLGGALYFQNQNSNGIYIIKYNNIFNNLANIAGGGLSIISASSFSNLMNTMDIYNTNFYNNFAPIGGALHSYETYINLYYSQIFNNEAYFGAGITLFNEKQYFFEINILNTNFSKNNAKKLDDNFGFGGAIYLKSTNLNIINSIFKENIASNGGVIYTRFFKLKNILNLENNHFLNNYAINGAVFFLNHEYFVLTNNTFTKNNCERGCIFYKYVTNNLKNLTILSYKNKYLYNSVNDKGTIFYIKDYNLQINISNNIINNNTANHNSLLYFDLQNSELNIFSNLFTNNNNINYGIIYSSGNNYKLNIYKNYVVNNIGGLGIFLYANGGKSNFNYNKFFENSGINGVIYTLTHDIKLNHNTFFKNIGQKGSDLYVDNSNIISNNNIFEKSLSYDIGGSIYLEKGAFYYSNLDIFNYTKSNTRGGAIVIYDIDSKLKLNNTTFINSMSTTGGCIYSNKGKVYIDNSLFLSNYGSSGGVIYSENSDIYLNNNNFTGNNAILSGGVFHASMNSYIFTNNTFFFNNFVQRDGGVGYFSLDSTWKCHNCKIINNSATSQGGVVLLANGNIDIFKSSINSNYALSGSIMYDASITNSRITFNNNSIYNNGHLTNTLVGGIMALYCNSKQCLAYISYNDFYNNKAEKGGVIYQHSGKSYLFINKNRFRYNSGKDGAAINTNAETLIIDNYFINNIANNGGCIYTENNAFLSIYNNIFLNNQANDIGGVFKFKSKIFQINNNIFKNNKAVSGSVLYLSESICNNCSTNLSKINNNYFEKNKASSNGAIYLSKKSNLYSSNNRFFNNDAKKGSIFYISEGGILFISNDTGFNNNAEFGSVLYHNGQILNLKNSKFNDNTALYSGGVIYISKISSNYIFLFNNNFFNNLAQEAGGVVFCDKLHYKCFCEKCSFKNNKGSSYGNNYASDISHITRINDNKIDYKDTELHLTLGKTITNPFNFKVIDNYNQVITSNTYSGLLECKILKINSNYSISAKITGTLTSIIQKGIISFNNFAIQGIEGSITNIQIKCIRNELSGIITSYEESKYLTIYSKSCNDGQKTSKINNDIIGCTDCLNNEYLDLRGADTCKVCPKGAVCEGSNNIYAKKDWWQSSSHLDKKHNKDCIFPFIYKNIVFNRCADLDSNKPWCKISNISWAYCNYSRPVYNFYQCPILNSCIGGKKNSTFIYGNDLCIEGHTGILCGICKDGYRKGIDNICVPCKLNEKSSISIYIIPILFILIIIVLISVCYYINCREEPSLEEIFKEWIDNFTLFDKYNENKLDYETFYKLLKFINLKIDYDELEELIKIIDINNDKFVDKREYLLLMCKLKFNNGSNEYLGEVINKSKNFINCNKILNKEINNNAIEKKYKSPNNQKNNEIPDIIDDGVGVGLDLGIMNLPKNTIYKDENILCETRINIENDIKNNDNIENVINDIENAINDNNVNDYDVNDNINDNDNDNINDNDNDNINDNDNDNDNDSNLKIKNVNNDNDTDVNNDNDIINDNAINDNNVFKDNVINDNDVNLKIKDVLKKKNINNEELEKTLELIENYKTESNINSNENLLMATINAHQTDTASRNISGLNNKNKLYKPTKEYFGDTFRGNDDEINPDTDIKIDEFMDFDINIKSAGFESIMSGSKIIFSHFQIITSFNTFNLEWPPLFVEIKNKFGFLNIDFLQIIPADCIVHVDYYNSLLISIISPIFIIIAILLFGKFLEYRNKIEANIYKDFTLKLIFIFLFIIYPGITQIIFELFICTEVEGINYLSKDLRYQCYDETWTKWSFVSFISIFIYPIGIPLLFYIILKKNENKLFTEFKYKLDDNGNKPSNIKNRYGFLYDRYKNDVYYFECIEFLRKLILVGAILFLYKGSIMQIAIAFIVSTVFFILHIKLCPFKDENDEKLQTITLLASMITLFSAIMLNAVQNTDEKYRNGYGKELFEILMPFSNIVVIAIMIYVICIELYANLESVFMTFNNFFK